MKFVSPGWLFGIGFAVLIILWLGYVLLHPPFPRRTTQGLHRLDAWRHTGSFTD